MKRFVQTGFLPLLALSVALGFSSSAQAKDPHRTFKHDAAPVVTPDLPSPYKGSELNCEGLTKRNGMDAWQRGFEQATSGQRAEADVTIDSKKIVKHAPCEEYKRFDREQKCCKRAFKAGLGALRNYMILFGALRPSEPKALACYEAYETGLDAARRICKNPSGCVSMSDLSLKSDFPGCMAMGFIQKKNRCAGDSAQTASTSAYTGATNDRREPSSKNGSIEALVNSGFTSSAGSAASQSDPKE